MSNGTGVTELVTKTGAIVQVITGKPSDFEVPGAIAIAGHSAFITNGTNVTEFNIVTGAVRVIKGTSYGFDAPYGIAITGHDAYVANSAGQSVTEFNTVTDSPIRVLR